MFCNLVISCILLGEIPQMQAAKWHFQEDELSLFPTARRSKTADTIRAP